MYHRRLPGFEWIDQITFRTVYRYKTSDLSGDEWRFNIYAEFFFKGQRVHETTFRSMEVASMLLPSILLDLPETTVNQISKLDETTCDEPGCSQRWAGRLQLKRLTASDGSWLDQSENTLKYFRKFCLKHIQRGDCSREDADDNYIPLDKIDARDTQNAEESPSIFGGIVDLSGSDNP